MRTERPWAGVDEAMDKLRAAVDAFEASGGTNVRTLVDPLEALYRKKLMQLEHLHGEDRLSIEIDLSEWVGSDLEPLVGKYYCENPLEGWGEIAADAHGRHIVFAENKPHFFDVWEPGVHFDLR
jgi:hypothetical protein